jgi:hypothetical protein
MRGGAHPVPETRRIFFLDILLINGCCSLLSGAGGSIRAFGSLPAGRPADGLFLFILLFRDRIAGSGAGTARSRYFFLFQFINVIIFFVGLFCFPSAERMQRMKRRQNTTMKTSATLKTGKDGAKENWNISCT